MTPESALFARLCIENELDLSIPAVTAFAFYIQETCNTVLDLVDKLEETLNESVDDEAGGVTHCEDMLSTSEFILDQLLKIAQGLDYADETGRQKMFLVIRKTLWFSLEETQLIRFSI